MMKKKYFLTFLLLMGAFVQALADVTVKAVYTKEGADETVEATEAVSASVSGDAPLHVSFSYEATYLPEGASVEWHIRNAAANINLTRYEPSFSFDFTASGQTQVILQVMVDNEAVETVVVNVTVSESHLEMPNAFSPNDDGKNDIYGAKGCNDKDAKGAYKSIVEFHGYIFNRWGQKLYEWTNIDGGWDGTYRGRPVKTGVYYVYVKARGADGVEYNIRRDVNLIRDHNNVEESTSVTE